MRPNISTLILLTLLLGMFGAWQHADRRRREDRRIEATRLVRERIESEIRLRSALTDAELTDEGWVVEVSTRWFGILPENPLLAGEGRPWIEVAVDAEEHLTEPESLRIDEDTSQWWYNPRNGTVCARVPHRPTGSSIRALHDAVNR